MTSDEQEAKSIAHAAVGVTVRRLSSGNWAYYSQWGVLLAVGIWPTAHQLGGLLDDPGLHQMPIWMRALESKRAAALDMLKELGL